MSLCSQGNAGHLLNLLSYSGCTMILSYISKIVCDLFRHKVKSKSLFVTTDKQLIAFVMNLLSSNEDLTVSVGCTSAE